MPGADDKQMIEALGSNGPLVGFGQAAISRTGWSAPQEAAHLATGGPGNGPVRGVDIPDQRYNRLFGPSRSLAS